MTKKFVKSEIFDRLINKIYDVLSFYLYKKRSILIKEHKIVTFSFDDCHETSLLQASKILDNYDKKGTFYMCLGLSGKSNTNGNYADSEQINHILKNGHELACHSYSHLDCRQNTLADVMTDCNKNRNTSKHLFGVDMNSFSYPYGSACPSAKKMLSKEYITLRTVKNGINSNCIDLAALKAVPMYGGVERNVCFEWLKRLKYQSGWLIFYTHDVMNNHSYYGCTEELINNLLIECINNNIKILSIKEVVKEYIELIDYT